MNLHVLCVRSKHIQRGLTDSEHYIHYLQSRFCDLFRMHRDEDCVLKNSGQRGFHRQPGSGQQVVRFVHDEEANAPLVVRSESDAKEKTTGPAKKRRDASTMDGDISATSIRFQG